MPRALYGAALGGTTTDATTVVTLGTFDVAAELASDGYSLAGGGQTVHVRWDGRQKDTSNPPVTVYETAALALSVSSAGVLSVQDDGFAGSYPFRFHTVTSAGVALAGGATAGPLLSVSGTTLQFQARGLAGTTITWTGQVYITVDV